MASTLSAARAEPEPPAAIAAERPDGVVSTGIAQTAQEAQEVREFWTPERMAAAQPLDLAGPGPAEAPSQAGTSGGGVVTEPYAASTPAPETSRAARRPRVPRTAGKLFFTDQTGLFQFVCSAATIGTRRKNQVITAGHCVHEGDGGSWYANFQFVPRYRNGNEPYGRWVARKAWAFKGWIDDGRFKYDQAIIAFRKLNGRRLVRVVGGNGLAWGRSPSQRRVHVWGWPEEGPRYDGETARRCEGRTSRWRDTADAKIRCRMTGGASGGPWLLHEGRTVNTGYIFAVTSRRTLRGPRYLLARPLPRAITRLVRRAN